MICGALGEDNKGSCRGGVWMCHIIFLVKSELGEGREGSLSIHLKMTPPLLLVDLAKETAQISKIC